MTLDINARVKTIIDAQGETVTYKQQTAAAFNSTTLANAITYTSHTIKAHFRKYNAKEITGLVREGDREVRIAADAISFVPEANDVVEVSGDVFKVVAVDNRVAYGSDSLYILTVRGGY